MVTGCRLNEAAWVIHHNSIKPNRFTELKEKYPFVAIMPKALTKTKVEYVWYIHWTHRELAMKILGGGIVNPLVTDKPLLIFRRALEYWMTKAVNESFAEVQEIEPTNARSIRRYRGN